MYILGLLASFTRYLDVRGLLAMIVLPISFGYTIGACVVGCAQLTPEDKASIARDAVRISVCQEEVRFCKRDAGDAAAAKCWPVYDECMRGEGLTADGGK